MKKILLPLLLIFSLSVYSQNYVASKSKSAIYYEGDDDYKWGEFKQCAFRIFICDTLVTVSTKVPSRYLLLDEATEVDDSLAVTKVWYAADEKRRLCVVCIATDKKDGNIFLAVYYEKKAAFIYSSLREEKSL